MHCPKCGWEQEDGKPDCRCGIIFAKMASSPRITPPVTRRAPVNESLWSSLAKDWLLTTEESVNPFYFAAIGQLDGEHVAYALLGERQRSVAVALIPVLMVFGWIGWKGWFLWVGLAGLMGLAHPPVRNPARELGTARVLIGWIALLIFAVTFSWEPFILR